MYWDFGIFRVVITSHHIPLVIIPFITKSIVIIIPFSQQPIISTLVSSESGTDITPHLDILIRISIFQWCHCHLQNSPIFFPMYRGTVSTRIWTCLGQPPFLALSLQCLGAFVQNLSIRFRTGKNRVATFTVLGM